MTAQILEQTTSSSAGQPAAPAPPPADRLSGANYAGLYEQMPTAPLVTEPGMDMLRRETAGQPSRLFAIGAVLGHIGSLLGPLGGLLGASWRPLGRLLGRSWGALGSLRGAPGAILGGFRRTTGRPQLALPL